MPRVTQYIRDEDIDKWKSIKNKSQWIHNALNGIVAKEIRVTLSEGLRPTINGKPMREAVGPSVQLQEKTVQVPSPRLENGLCKVHGVQLDSRGRCMQKGCKYS